MTIIRLLLGIVEKTNFSNICNLKIRLNKNHYSFNRVHLIKEQLAEGKIKLVKGHQH